MRANTDGTTAALPDQADPRYKYTVRARDTLTSIALRFDATVAWIKQVNHMFTDFIFPGDQLIIPPMPDSVVPVDPIDVALYRGNERRHDIPGKLLVLSWDLRFEPRRTTKRPMTVDLGSHIHHRLMAHPLYFDDICAADDISAVDDPNRMFLLAIVYLLDLADKESVRTIYFAGQRSDLDRYGALIERVARDVQKQRGVTVPTLGRITARRREVAAPPREGQWRSAASIVEPVWRRVSVPMRDVELRGGPSLLVDMSVIGRIRGMLPTRARSDGWGLVYRLSVDGCSYQTLYQKTAGCPAVVVMARNDNDEVFGAYLSGGIKRSRGYYGNGESFVFRTKPAFEAYTWIGPSANSYFVAGGAKELMVGGGGGGNAIYFGDDLLVGRSQACLTFGSPPLTLREHFQLLEIEVWKIAGCKDL
jgi:hypothetical protein